MMFLQLFKKFTPSVKYKPLLYGLNLETQVNGQCCRRFDVCFTATKARSCQPSPVIRGNLCLDMPYCFKFGATFRTSQFSNEKCMFTQQRHLYSVDTHISVHGIEFKDNGEDKYQADDEAFPENMPNDERALTLFNDLVERATITKREYNVLDVIQELVNADFGKQCIIEALENADHIFRNYSVDLWKTSVSALLESGFKPTGILAMIVKNRHILNMTRSDVLSVTYALRQVFITEKRMIKVCTELPILLTRSFSEIEEQFDRLRDIFPKNDLYRLLDLSPTLFLTDIEEVNLKLDYVSSNLGVAIKHIASTKLFSHSMEHIITRCEFLIKAGLYEKPNKHGQSTVENAPLRHIVDTSDKQYCKKVGFCTLTEYRAFCDMFDLFDARSENFIGGQPDDIENDLDLD